MQLKTPKGGYVRGEYVRHVRTLARHDVDLYRLPDGREVEAMSLTSDGRDMPRIVPANAGRYPGYPVGA